MCLEISLAEWAGVERKDGWRRFLRSCGEVIIVVAMGRSMIEFSFAILGRARAPAGSIRELV